MNQTLVQSNPGLIGDCLKTLSLDGRLMDMDSDGQCIMEVDDFTQIRGLPWASLWPAESRRLVEASVEAAAAGRVSRFSAECPTAKGTLKSWDVVVTPLRDDRGVVIGLQSLSQDVTAREMTYRESALVSRELAHRIQNLFAVVDGIIQLSSRNEPAAAPFVRALRERLAGLGRAIAYIHAADRPEMVASAGLSDLAATVLEPYRQMGAAVSIVGDDAPVAVARVTAVAMVLNELATNAMKYGALGRPDGRLDVVLARRGADVLIQWREMGGTDVEAPGGAGFGTTLLDSTIQHQLGGTIRRDWSPQGLAVEMTIPLDRLG